MKQSDPHLAPNTKGKDRKKKKKKKQSQNEEMASTVGNFFAKMVATLLSKLSWIILNLHNC